MATQVLYPDVNINPEPLIVPAGMAFDVVTNATGYALLNNVNNIPPIGAGFAFRFPAHAGGGTPSSIKLKFSIVAHVVGEPVGYLSILGSVDGSLYPPELIIENFTEVEPFPTPSFIAEVETGRSYELELITFTTLTTNVGVGFKLNCQTAQGKFVEVTNCHLEVTVPDPPLGLVRLHKPLYYGDHLIHNVDIDDEFNQIDSKLSGGTTSKQVQFTKSGDVEPALETINSGGGPMIEAQQNSVVKFKITAPPVVAADSITIDFLEHEYKIPTNILLWFPGKTILIPGEEHLASPIVNSDFILQEVRMMINARSTVVPPTCENPNFDVTFTLAVQKKDEDTVTVIQSKTIPVTAFGDMSVPLKFLEGNLYSFKTGDRIIFKYQQARQAPIFGCAGADQIADIWIKELSVNLMGYHFYKGSTDISQPPTTT